MNRIGEGGGGASDVRTGPAGSSGLASRLIVGDGGGGLGFPSRGLQHDGQPGTRSAGGAGGPGASTTIACDRGPDPGEFFTYINGDATGGGAGTLGVGGSGGNAATGFSSTGPGFPASGGGGGGGGYYGGGGGSGGYQVFLECHDSSPADPPIISGPLSWGSGSGATGSSYVTPKAICRPRYDANAESGDGEVDITYNPQGC